MTTVIRRNNIPTIAAIPHAEFQAAKRLYAEQQLHDGLVIDTYLKVFILALSLIAVGMIFVELRTAHILQNATCVIPVRLQAAQEARVPAPQWQCCNHEGQL